MMSAPSWASRIGVAAALAARRAGDEGDLACYSSSHAELPCSLLSVLRRYLMTAPASTGSGTPVM